MVGPVRGGTAGVRSERAGEILERLREARKAEIKRLIAQCDLDIAQVKPTDCQRELASVNPKRLVLRELQAPGRLGQADKQSVGSAAADGMFFCRR